MRIEQCVDTLGARKPLDFTVVKSHQILNIPT